MTLFSKGKAGSAKGWGVRTRLWTLRAVVAILIAGAVTAAFYLSRPHDPPGRLDLALRNLFVKVPWYYSAIHKAEANARRSNRRSWVPGVLAHRAATEELRADLLRSNARSELISMRQNAWPAIPALMSALHNRDPVVQAMAADVLANIKADESPTFEKLKVGLKDDERPALAFRSVLGWRTILDRPNQRRFALIGLGACGTAAKVALPAIIQDAEDKQSETHELRALAFAAMGGLGSQATEALPALKHAIEDSDDWPDVRAEAVSAIAAVAPANPKVIALLQSQLADEKALVRIAAANALIQRAPPDTLFPILTNALNHKLPAVRHAALDALAHLGRSARPARPAIQDLLLDENESVRNAAKQILETFD